MIIATAKDIKARAMYRYALIGLFEITLLRFAITI